MALLRVENISKTYNHKPALDHVSLDLDEGHILCLLGPSGCGKTTLLRIIAGLETPDTGTVYFDGKDMSMVEPHLRNFGMMFQEFALFPHKDVLGNITFGLKMQKKTRKDIKRRADHMLSLVGLEGYAKRNVSELSGGERQRVALARTLAPHPRLVLLDEPLGSLDRALRERLLLEVRDILKKVGVTSIFVTHDQTEAFAIADIIVVMNKGVVEQTDTPENLYARPANAKVARFLGFHNLVKGNIMADGAVSTELGVLLVADHTVPPGTDVTVLIRPDGAKVRDKPNRADKNETTISGIVNNCLFKGKTYHLELQTDSGHILLFDLPNESKPSHPGLNMELVLSSSAFVIMERE
jgi:ABC-type Fe3+/spermidine/putrescine transport system ATPase subunit